MSAQKHGEDKTLTDIQGNETLQDTATSINAVAREPTHQAFTPIGHISLDTQNADAKHLELDIPTEGVFWIKTFFVSHSFRSQGIGRAAMDEVERMAVEEPLLARILMLDTVQKDDQMREGFATDEHGTLPKVSSIRAFASC